MQIVNESFARLTAGGTFFISKAPGVKANQISVAITAGSSNTVTVRNGDSGNAFTFHGTNHSDQKTIASIVRYGKNDESISIVAVSTKQFQVTGSQSGFLGTAVAGRVFRSPNICFLITISDYDHGETFTILGEELEIYKVSGIDDLRSQINNQSRLLRMPARGTIHDDVEVDGPGLTMLEAALLEGGNGLPIIPTADNIPLCFVNYKENDSGVREVHSKMYTWVGDITTGSWIMNDNQPEPTAEQ